MENFINEFFIFGAQYLFWVIVGIALIYFFKQPKAIKKHIIILGIIALPLVYIIAKIASIFYYNSRPFAAGNFMPLIPHDPDNGFPSDHTLISAALSSILYPYNKKVSIAAWILTVFVGVSRVYVGVHHPVDIAGSIAISIFVTSFVYIAVKYVQDVILKKD